jgi:hypothetical protein
MIAPLQSLQPIPNPGIGLHEPIAGIRRDDKSGRDRQPRGEHLPKMSRLAPDPRQILKANRV